MAHWSGIGIPKTNAIALEVSYTHRNKKQQVEWCSYNRLVTGLPQRQIEQELSKQQQQQQQMMNDSSTTTTTTTTTKLQGIVAMQLGLELRRAYVNDLAVLEDGICVSALDDGHVQLWKYAALEDDVIRPARQEQGGVDSVVALSTRRTTVATATAAASQVAFATAGRGTLQLWNKHAEPLITLPGAMPGTPPASLQCVFGGTPNDTSTCLAARFEMTYKSDPHQFRFATSK